jgi:hypothetical protein
VLDVLVEGVGAQFLLDLDEAVGDVPLVGQEEQARVEAAEAVRAVGEGVAAAEQAGAVVAVGVGQLDVGGRASWPTG